MSLTPGWSCRYDVYASLEAEAAYLKLNNDGVYLLQLQAAFADLQVYTP